MPLDDAAAPGDILRGGARIHAFVVELFGDESITQGQIYHWADQGHLPCGKLGGQLIASKKKIIAKISEAASGAPAVEPSAPPRGRSRGRQGRIGGRTRLGPVFK